MRGFHVELPDWSGEARPERPVCGPVLVSIAGVLVPILLALYGVLSAARGEAVVMGYGGLFSLYGVNAIVFGVGAIALGVLLHCAAFWDNIHDGTPACARTKLLCLCVMGVCAYVLCIRMLPGLWG